MGQRVNCLSREAFLKRVVVRPVELADGMVVCIRALPASFIIAGANDFSKTFETANLLVNSLCDEEGKLLFSEGEKDQTLAVDHLSLKIIVDAIMELNGLLTKQDEVSEAEKN